MKWIDVKEQPIPRDGKEYLTKNNKQGGVKTLVIWDKMYKHFRIKEEYISEGNAGTHWIKIPK